MVVGMCKLKLYAPWVHSLKEKRMIIRSLLGKVRSKFSISIAEVEAMDVHQTVIIGFSIVTNETKAADAIINQVIGYIEENTEADLLDIEREIISDF
ncbi:DUF503 domain-containing protein [Niameybacter massiliensis]|uniref:DUF503 domain-containing protein n=1 Tax=Niameybacter massiliensis TaxID=1658108 RepID=UPI0006B52A9F|nr:DUF503 domain-containing protein [Niameybacter massiliensis]